MRPGRRAALQAALQAGLGAWATLAGVPARAAGAATAAPPVDDDDRISPERRLRFPRDHGAHPGARIEWWYATGWLQAPGAGGAARLIGFQLTFFRSRTGLAEQLPGRFAPRQLLFAHAAVSDIGAASPTPAHRHAQRISRWSGDETLPEAHAARADTRLAIGRWTLARESGAAAAPYRALLAAPEAGFALDLRLQPTQPLLLQGVAGHSRKGPQPTQASHYYSQPQLAVAAELTLDGQRQSLQGRGWLDHEWSDELLAPGAVGWDWIGINLDDGSALTAFVLRGADDRPIWAGGSHRPAAGGVAGGVAAGVTDGTEAATDREPRNFGPQDVEFTALRRWSSPATGASYPVHWRIRTPIGSFELRALLDAQELDSRASTGTVYWEGLAELLAPGGNRVGLGYLEMTGRAQPLKLGL